MSTEAALPEVEQTAASTEALEAARAIDNDVNAGELTAEQQAEAAQKAAEAKPEKTPEQREIERLRRGIDRRTRQLSDARAQLDLTRQEKGVNYQQTADDSEPLSLTRSQIAELVKAEAAKLAPTIQQEAVERERRQSVVQSLASTWGQEKFDAISNDLDDAFGGLVDRRTGQPKPAIEAVFEADNPASVIEFLSNPEHEDEADKVSRMSAAQAGKYIAKLEAKLDAEKLSGKPKASKAPAPLESVRGGGNVTKDPSTMTDKEFADWRRSQIKQRN